MFRLTDYPLVAVPTLEESHSQEKLMTEPLGNSIATSQPRELNATEIEAVGGAIGPLVAGLLAFDLFGIGVNIGLWGPELSDSIDVSELLSKGKGKQKPA